MSIPIPLLPGFGSKHDHNRYKNYHGKKSQQFVARGEVMSQAPKNLITHVSGSFSARCNSEELEKEQQEIKSARMSTHQVCFRPESPRVKQIVNVNSRNKWLKLDREVLRFFMYFKEAVHESPLEHFRVRKCVLLYYLANDTVQISEPRVENSGLQQGAFLHNQPVNQLPGIKGEKILRLKDLGVGSELTLFGRTFLIVDADGKTRGYFAEKLNLELSSALPYPLDPVAVKKVEMESRVPVVSPKAQDTLKNFLEYGTQCLSFTALWENPAELPAHNIRRFMLHYYLADDTIEIKEVYNANSGREPFPKFLSRRKCVKEDGTNFEPSDFKCGEKVQINGRMLQLLTCNTFTRDFYTGIGIVQTNYPYTEPRKQYPKMVPAPYNGFGSEEDSLGSCYNLVLKPPKKDYHRQLTYADQIIKLRLLLQSHLPQDKDRVLLLSFHLEDETLSLYEPLRRNSGIPGGKFLERGRYINNETGKKFLTEDFRSALLTAVSKRYSRASPGDTGDIIEILKRKYQVLSGDSFSMEFYGIEKPIQEEVRVAQSLSEQFAGVNLRSTFRSVDIHRFGTLPTTVIMDTMTKLGLNFEAGNLDNVLRLVSQSKTAVWYNDLCDVLSLPLLHNESVMFKDITLRKLQGLSENLRGHLRENDVHESGYCDIERLYEMNVSDVELKVACPVALCEGGMVNYDILCDRVFDFPFTNTPVCKACGSTKNVVVKYNLNICHKCLE